MPEEKTTYSSPRARIRQQKRQFLEQLAKVPLIEVICQKVGISRPTFYRWRKEDPEFARQSDEAILMGTDVMDDVAESQLIQLIKNGDRVSVHFYLKHRHHRYSNRAAMQRMLKEQNTENTEITEEDQRKIDLALKNIKDYQRRVSSSHSSDA